MTKNRTAQLMLQSAFCAIGIIGIIASFGFFDMVWRWDFYIQFTNLSNYFCIAIMFAELCHLRHMNHSPEFYAEIERVFTDYKKCHRWLNENGGAYLSRLPQ